MFRNRDSKQIQPPAEDSDCETTLQTIISAKEGGLGTANQTQCSLYLLLHHSQVSLPTSAKEV